MRQLTIRVTDPQYASLQHVLTQAKAERGARYSMSDLCARLLMVQLSYSDARDTQDAPHRGMMISDAAKQARVDAATGMTRGLGYVHIVPPPPVPKLEPTIWPPAAAPQPERLTHAQPTRESDGDMPLPQMTGDLTLEESIGPAADGADPDANESAFDALSRGIEKAIPAIRKDLEEDDGNVGN